MDDILINLVDNITENNDDVSNSIPSKNELSPDEIIKKSEEFNSSKEISENVEENIENKIEENVEKESEGKTWKLDEHGKKVSTMVPKSRFDEKNNLAKELEAKLIERDRKLAEYEERSKNAVDLSKFDLNNYATPEEWARDVQAEIRRQAKEDVIHEIEQQKIIEKVKTAETNLIQGFDRNIEETKSEIPDIVNVVTEFAKYKEYIPRETIYTIMGDENSAKVIHEIMTTENMLRNISEMSPVQAARVIGKISAKFDLQKESDYFSQSRSENTREIPSTPIASKPKVAGSPNLKGSSDKSIVREETTSNKISKKESAEFAKLFSNR